MTVLFLNMIYLQDHWRAVQSEIAGNDGSGGFTDGGGAGIGLLIIGAIIFLSFKSISSKKR